MAPGDRLNIIDRPAYDEDYARFPKQHAAFLKKMDQQGHGTALAEWPIITRSQAEELKYLGFHTVEQIADAKDGAGDVVPAFQQLKARAKAFLDLAKNSTAPLEQLQTQLEEERQLRAQLAESVLVLQQQLRAMGAPAGTGPNAQQIALASNAQKTDNDDDEER
jgi:hypothetical protein